MLGIQYVSVFTGAGVLAWIGGAVVLAAEENGEKPYTIKDGKVDQHTYNGWRRYTESCLRCHGPDGAGSSVEWRAQYLANGQPDLIVRTIISTLFKVSLDSLKPRFGAGK